MTLTVTDDAGNTATTTQAVTVGTVSPGGLTAAFTFSPTAPLADDVVNFNATTSTSADPITNYKWDFGDGGTASTAAKTTSHTFVDPRHLRRHADDSGTPRDGRPRRPRT